MESVLESPWRLHLVSFRCPILLIWPLGLFFLVLSSGIVQPGFIGSCAPQLTFFRQVRCETKGCGCFIFAGGKMCRIFFIFFIFVCFPQFFFFHLKMHVFAHFRIDFFFFSSLLCLLVIFCKFWGEAGLVSPQTLGGGFACFFWLKYNFLKSYSVNARKVPSFTVFKRKRCDPPLVSHLSLASFQAICFFFSVYIFLQKMRISKMQVAVVAFHPGTRESHQSRLSSTSSLSLVLQKKVYRLGQQNVKYARV